MVREILRLCSAAQREQSSEGGAGDLSHGCTEEFLLCVTAKTSR
jgi:hypothetical protein